MDTAPADPFDLERFVAAQAGGVYDRAAAEVRRGRKTSHWMWFVFPQIRGLGSSPMAVRWAIGSRAEATAYLAHPVLGPRLREICADLLELPPAVTAEQVFGAVDTMKLRSSMTLFAAVALDGAEFAAVLDRFFGGVPDPATGPLLGA